MRTGLLAKGIVGAAATMLLASGCSKGASSGQSTATRATASASTAAHRPASGGDQDALAAYRAMMNDLVAVARNPDENDPRLGSHASAGALTLLRYMMQDDRQKNLVGKGSLRLDPVIVKSGAAQVVIRDCADATQWLLYARDGKLENDVPGGRHRVDATIKEQDGVWRVERLYFDEVGTC